MPRIQTVLPIGPDGLPVGIGATGSGGTGGTGGAGGDAALEVRVSNLAASVVRQVDLDLATARAAVALDLPGVKVIYGFTVRRLSGLDAGSVKVHPGGPAVPGLFVDEGEARESISVSGLAVTNPGTGGLLQLEIYGASA